MPELDLSVVVDRIIDNALAVLQHPKSFEVLTQMGMEAVKSWRDKRKFPIVHQGQTVDDMEAALRRFLGKLRNEQFYPIQLVNTKRKRPASDSQTWAQFDPKRIDGIPKDIPNFLLRWDPRDAGTIILNLLVSTSRRW